MRSKWMIGLLSIVLLGILTACTGEHSSSNPSEDNNTEDNTGNAEDEIREDVTPEPVEEIELNVYWTGREDQFNDRVLSDVVQSAMPHVTFKMVKGSVDEMIVAGQPIDVMNVSQRGFLDVKDRRLTRDISDLVDKHDFDMSRFVPEHLEMMENISGEGVIEGFPDKAYFPYVNHATVYNKDIFDEMAVSYPEDNMTWDELIAKAKEVHRVVNGQQYYGLKMIGPGEIIQQLGVNYVNENNQADLSDPIFLKVFRIYQSTADAFGERIISSRTSFRTEKNVAMYAGNVRPFIEEATRMQDEMPNWDLVTFPDLEEAPDSVPHIAGVYMVTSISEYPDESLQLIDLLLGEELSQDITDQYMNPVFQQKNWEAVANRKQSLFIPTEYFGDGNKIFNAKINKMIEEGTDINTLLTEIEEELQMVVNEKQ